MDKSELGRILRELGEGVIGLSGVMDEAAKALEEFIPPEEHECWFEWISDYYGDAGAMHQFRCYECGFGSSVDVSEAQLATMYNAMRHLTPELLSHLAAEHRPNLLWAEAVAALDAAAAAMRRE